VIAEARESLRLGAFGAQDPQVRGVRTGARTIWLLFLLFPVLTALGAHGSVLGRVLILVAAVAFIAVYLVLVLSWRRTGRRRQTVALLGALIGISVGLTVAAEPGWGFLFIYCAATAALLSEPRIGFAAVLTCTALAGGLTALAGGSSGTCISFLTSTAGIGLLMLLMRDLRVRNGELLAARAELAQLAVAQERERFARDLHDLLGHTLSVIAIKAELAGRLLPERGEEAAHEVADLERVARAALSEVRDAVSGYRPPDPRRRAGRGGHGALRRGHRFRARANADRARHRGGSGAGVGGSGGGDERHSPQPGAALLGHRSRAGRGCRGRDRRRWGRHPSPRRERRRARRQRARGTG
jgi:signal transduction histidine kinase